MDVKHRNLSVQPVHFCLATHRPYRTFPVTQKCPPAPFSQYPVFFRHRLAVPGFLRMYFTCFSCLVVVARTSNTIFYENVENGHPCLVPDLRGKIFSFSPLSIILAVGYLWPLLC